MLFPKLTILRPCTLLLAIHGAVLLPKAAGAVEPELAVIGHFVNDDHVRSDHDKILAKIDYKMASDAYKQVERSIQRRDPWGSNPDWRQTVCH
ncbi:hypothetical protein BR93DRAFT_927012 [Coniochaeta sp. PMI_546]|nr:hypothetical protein BR93DRAFT_927012 [Coniochaeta sp. PMI_546]